MGVDCMLMFTCCTGGAAGSISRNLPAIHVCQANIWVQTHIKVITGEEQKKKQVDKHNFETRNFTVHFIKKTIIMLSEEKET